MTERRQVLTGALALAAAPFTLPSLISLVHAAPAALPPPVLFLFDQRFTSARQVAEQLAGAGQDVAGFEGDLLPLWSARLRPLWQTGPVAIGGLTNANALFLLETLGADHRLKLAQRVVLESAKGQQPAHEPLYHWLLVPRGQV